MESETELTIYRTKNLEDGIFHIKDLNDGYHIEIWLCLASQYPCLESVDELLDFYNTLWTEQEVPYNPDVEELK